MIKKTTLKTRAKKILRHERARKKLSGTKERPRLSFFRGTNSLYAQVIDDSAGTSFFGVSTNTKKSVIKGKNIKAAVELGKAIAEKCKSAGVSELVFDRGGNKYHGVTKAFADSVRECGIKF